MKTIHTNAKHIEWFSADEMHDMSKKWLSELEFCKKEQLFFEDLIRSYTLQILNNNHFEESKTLIDKLSKIVKETQTLINAIKSHEKELLVMVDGICEIQEETLYKKVHRNLIELVSEFQKRYQNIKTELFSLIKKVMKENKQLHIIDKK